MTMEKSGSGATWIRILPFRRQLAVRVINQAPGDNRRGGDQRNPARVGTDVGDGLLSVPQGKQRQAEIAQASRGAYRDEEPRARHPGDARENDERLERHRWRA